MVSLENMKNFQFKRVDFNDPMSIVNYGDDVMEFANEIANVYSALLKESNSDPIDFTKDIENVTAFCNDLKQLETKNTKSSNIKGIFENIVKKIFNANEDEINCDNYADLYEKYCENIDYLCTNMEKEIKNTKRLIDINKDFQQALLGYIKLLENVINIGTEDKNDFFEKIKRLEVDNNAENYILINTGKKYIIMFERKLKDLSESLALNKITHMELVEKAVPDMELVMMYSTFTKTTAPNLKIQASSIVGVQQQKDKINSYGQLITTINNTLTENSNTLKDNIKNVYDMSTKGSIDTKTLLELRDNAVKTLQDLSSIQQNSLKARTDNSRKIEDILHSIDSVSNLNSSFMLTDNNFENAEEQILIEDIHTKKLVK